MAEFQARLMAEFQARLMVELFTREADVRTSKGSLMEKVASFD